MASEAKATESFAQGERVERATCPDHGDYESKVRQFLHKEIRTGCPECTKARQDAEDARRQEREALEARIRLSAKLGAAAIPKRFADRTFGGYRATSVKQQKALFSCREYAENFAGHLEAGRCLLMFGKPGTGKTHLAAAIANQLISETPATAVYRTVGGVLQAIKATYDGCSGRSESEVFAGLIAPDLLILDEVGATKPTEFELATLFQIINGRYEQVRPTLIVSNLMPAELAGAIGERCVDRLREGGAVVLAFDWESARSTRHD